MHDPYLFCKGLENNSNWKEPLENPVQLPDKSRANFTVRICCSGLYPEEFWKPTSIFLSSVSLIIRNFFLMFNGLICSCNLQLVLQLNPPGRRWCCLPCNCPSSLLLWKYSRWTCSSRALGQDDLQRLLSAWTILWFCDFYSKTLESKLFSLFLCSRHATPLTLLSVPDFLLFVGFPSWKWSPLLLWSRLQHPGLPSPLHFLGELGTAERNLLCSHFPECFFTKYTAYELENHRITGCFGLE